MRISARNQLSGTVVEVKRGTVMTEVVVDIGGGKQMVSLISTDSADELKLQTGNRVYVIVKSTEVMVALPDVR